MQAVENAEDFVEEGIADPQQPIRSRRRGDRRRRERPDALHDRGPEGSGCRGARRPSASPTIRWRRLEVCSHPILADTGEEVVAGSTRMKAGTAQKVILNLLSTLIMVRLGRVYRGLMVHMRATNAKLRRRSEIMVAQITGCDDATAFDALRLSDGDLKVGRPHRAGRQARRMRRAPRAKRWQSARSPVTVSPNLPNHVVSLIIAILNQGVSFSRTHHGRRFG